MMEGHEKMGVWRSNLEQKEGFSEYRREASFTKEELGRDLGLCNLGDLFKKKGYKIRTTKSECFSLASKTP